MAATTGTGAKQAARKAVAKRATAKQGAATAAKTGTTKRAAGHHGAHHASDPSHYTDPALRDRLKDEVLAGDKGGRPRQWSARKAQLLAHEYEAAGGGYTGGKSPAQQHLQAWTDERWTTADKTPAIRGKTTARYLPEKAWEELTPAQRRATDKKKRSASTSGRQFVANTGAAAAARRDAVTHDMPAKAAAKTTAKTTAKTAAKTTAKRAAVKQAPAKQASAKQAAARKRARA